MTPPFQGQDLVGPTRQGFMRAGLQCRPRVVGSPPSRAQHTSLHDGTALVQSGGQSGETRSLALAQHPPPGAALTMPGQHVEALVCCHFPEPPEAWLILILKAPSCGAQQSWAGSPKWGSSGRSPHPGGTY